MSAPNSTLCVICDSLDNSDLTQTYEGGVDWAGALYACAVGSNAAPANNSDGVSLRGAKQWWYFLSTSGQANGPSPY